MFIYNAGTRWSRSNDHCFIALQYIIVEQTSDIQVNGTLFKFQDTANCIVFLGNSHLMQNRSSDGAQTVKPGQRIRGDEYEFKSV